MKEKSIFLGIALCLSVLFSCKTKQDEYKKSLLSTFSYSKTIETYQANNSLVIKYLYSNDSVVIPISKLPLKRILLLSSSPVGYLENLNALDKVVGVYDPQWIYSPQLHQNIKKGESVNLGNANTADLESILPLMPDAVITLSDPSKTKLLEQIKSLHIPVIYIDEYKEGSPLGKAEYIKVFGELTGKEKKADSLFSVIENNYLTLKEKAKTTKTKPTIFTNSMRGDTWFMSGGASFNAHFIADAGGYFLWSDNNQEGAISLSFEEVFTKAKKADLWLNAGSFSSLKQLGESYKNNRLFNAFKKGEVYTFIKRENATGANDAFENGAVRADWVLQDYIKIIHPEILPEKDFYFYKKLN